MKTQQLRSPGRLRRLFKNMRDVPELYLMILPFIVYLIIFKYAPMYGVQIAFKDYNPAEGYWGSPFVGLEHFRNFFELPIARVVIMNTLRISLASLFFTFFLPVVLALMFNQLQNRNFRRFAQTASYIPNFISTVVIVGMLGVFLNKQVGVLNQVREMFGLETIDYMNRAETFLPVYIISGLWSSLGWGTIIYTGALSAINPELYEAATIDGASKLKQIRHIELPVLLPLISIMFILAVGNVMSVGWEKVYLMQKPLNISVSEIISTYTYKTGILNTQFSYSTAIGLFNSVVNIVLLVIANLVSRRLSGSSLF